jgi:hypothetical protein
MIRAKTFFCADGASVDARTNTLCAFHITEQLNAAAFPIAVPRLSVMSLLSREAGDPSNVELQLQIHLGENQLFRGPVPINFAQQLTARTILEMQGFVVPSPGTLRFVLANDGVPIGSWEVLVNQVGQPRFQMVFPGPIAQPPVQ